VSFDRLRHRLRQGRPLVLDADTGASFRTRGVEVDLPGAVGVLLRERPEAVLEHYRAEVLSRVDVLRALTADTTPRALAEVGMAYRSARLTGQAIELALEVAADAAKPIAVAGVLGSQMVAPMEAKRVGQEFLEHAERLAVAGCELLIAQGQGSQLELMSAVAAAVRTGLPTWAVVECTPAGEPAISGSVSEIVAQLEDAGATVILFEVATIQHGVSQLRNAAAVLDPETVSGVLLAGGQDCVRGFPDRDSVPGIWARHALDLDANGARVIGGGAGTTEEHTVALALALGAIHPSLPVPRPA
jgi:methionine synthase I (cobalamin-dependent)